MSVKITKQVRDDARHGGIGGGRLTTTFDFVVNDKRGFVVIDDNAPPAWGGDELTEDEQIDVLNEIPD
jgi:hypothetical protein